MMKLGKEKEMKANYEWFEVMTMLKTLHKLTTSIWNIYIHVVDCSSIGSDVFSGLKIGLSFLGGRSQKI